MKRENKIKSTINDLDIIVLVLSTMFQIYDITSCDA